MLTPENKSSLPKVGKTKLRIGMQLTCNIRDCLCVNEITHVSVRDGCIYLKHVSGIPIARVGLDGVPNYHIVKNPDVSTNNPMINFLRRITKEE